MHAGIATFPPPAAAHVPLIFSSTSRLFDFLGSFRSSHGDLYVGKKIKKTNSLSSSCRPRRCSGLENRVSLEYQGRNSLPSREIGFRRDESEERIMDVLGGKLCFNFSAFSESWSTNVYRCRWQRTLNLMLLLCLFFLIRAAIYPNSLDQSS